MLTLALRHRKQVGVFSPILQGICYLLSAKFNLPMLRLCSMFWMPFVKAIEILQLLPTLWAEVVL